MKTVTVKFKQELTFEQELEVTEEEFETLQKDNGEFRIQQPFSYDSRNPTSTYEILTSKVDFTSPIEEGDIEDFEIIEE